MYKQKKVLWVWLVWSNLSSAAYSLVTLVPVDSSSIKKKKTENSRCKKIHINKMDREQTYSTGLQRGCLSVIRNREPCNSSSGI